jgi:hypothetical protein
MDARDIRNGEVCVLETMNVAFVQAYRACTNTLAKYQNPTVLVYGGDASLWAALVYAGCDVVLLHNLWQLALNSRMHIRQFLPTELIKRHLRIEYRREGEMEELIAESSAVLCARILHHLRYPRSVFGKMLQGEAPVILLDTTVELLKKTYADEERRLGVANENLSLCEEGARAMGLHTLVDVEDLFKACPGRSPAYLIPELKCCYCDGGPQCLHYGRRNWMALYPGLSLGL